MSTQLFYPYIREKKIHAFPKALVPKECKLFQLEFELDTLRGCPHGVMVKAMDYGIVVREFVLQSRYYVHFQAKTLGKGMNPLILLAMG